MEFLSQNNVEFVAKDVQSDPAALKELIDLGSQSTPTLVIDGEVMVGFDPEKLLAKVKGS